jgi:Flp pilus assembly protein TadG
MTQRSVKLAAPGGSVEKPIRANKPARRDQLINTGNQSGRRHRQGQSLVEFSLIIPLVLLLTINAINFGGFIFAWITIANAARDGAQYMILSAASPGGTTPPSLGQIISLVRSDVTSLPNRSSLAVFTCANSTTLAADCTSLVDPEAPAYTLISVKVAYTYVPLIPLFTFRGLGIRATLPTTTIRRTAYMRVLQ